MGKKELECKKILRKLKAKGDTNAHRNTFLESYGTLNPKNKGGNF